jgi:hypothetical protein
MSIPRKSGKCFSHLAFVACSHQKSTPIIQIYILIAFMLFPQMQVIALSNLHYLSIFLKERLGV